MHLYRYQNKMEHSWHVKHMWILLYLLFYTKIAKEDYKLRIPMMANGILFLLIKMHLLSILAKLRKYSPMGCIKLPSIGCSWIITRGFLSPSSSNLLPTLYLTPTFWCKGHPSIRRKLMEIFWRRVWRNLRNTIEITKNNNNRKIKNNKIDRSSWFYIINNICLFN